MDSDSINITFYSVIKTTISLLLVFLIILSLMISLITGGLWVTSLMEEGSFNGIYLVICIVSRLVSGWLIKIKEKDGSN